MGDDEVIVYEKAPAKINLAIDVLGKRPDGFHEVEMVMTTIDLFDWLELSPLEEDRIEVSLESRFVPNDERNLAYKAAKVFKAQYNITQGVFIRIEKNIPVSAGLGGGSTNAAAVLRGMNQLFQTGLSLQELAELGATIGSDVPFCVFGHTALATGRGEIIQSLAAPPPCWVVLAKLDIGVSSRTVFDKLDLATISHPNITEVIDAIERQDFRHMCTYLGNALEQVTLVEHPSVAQLKERMKQLKARGVSMSGSGPTIYGLVEQEVKAQKIYNGLRGFCDDVYVVRTLG